MFEANLVRVQQGLSGGETEFQKITLPKSPRPLMEQRVEPVMQRAGKSESLLASGVLPRFEIEYDSQKENSDKGTCGYLGVGKDIVEGAPRTNLLITSIVF